MSVQRIRRAVVLVGWLMASWASALEVRLPDMSVSPDTEIVVPVTVDDTTGLDFRAASLTVHFDAAILTATGIDLKGTLAAGWLQAHASDPGELRIAMASARPTQGEGTLVNLLFRVKRGAMGETALTFTKLQFNEGKIPALSVPGRVSVSYAKDFSGDGVVDLSDLVQLSFFFGTNSPEGDLNTDGIVDIVDLILLIKSFTPIQKTK